MTRKEIDNLEIRGDSYEVSVVIPMYNEDAVIDELYDRLKQVLDNLGKTYEIIFVDDGSEDNTFKKLRAKQKTDDTVKLIKLRGNFGQTPALSAGFDNAKGSYIVAMDGDLQHLPEDIPKFINKLDDGYDLVSGWRKTREDNMLTRRLPSKIANWMMKKISKVNLHDFGTTFKAYKREVIQQMSLYGEFHRFIPVLASRIKASIIEIPIENKKQKHRKSHYNIGRTFTVFFDLIRLNYLMKYLTRPLQVFGTLGIFMDMIGMIIAIYLIYMKYTYNLPLMEYRAPLFILSLLLIVIGILFIVLGLLGEMIVKLFYDVAKIKTYNISKIYDGKSD